MASKKRRPHWRPPGLIGVMVNPILRPILLFPVELSLEAGALGAFLGDEVYIVVTAHQAAEGIASTKLE